MGRGRPVGSDIRQRLIDILAVKGQAYGYELHKIYCELFPPCTREVVYYHMRTGVKLGQFVIDKVVDEKGEYSWGPTVQKTYYRIGPAAQPRQNEAIDRNLKARKLSSDKVPAVEQNIGADAA